MYVLFLFRRRVAVFLAPMLLLSCSDPSSPERPAIHSKTFASLDWSPKVCPTSGTNLHNVEISSDNFQAKHLSYPWVYANYINRPWRMLFSQNVKYVGPQFNKFNVQRQANTDYLSLTHAYGTQTYYGLGGWYPTAPPLNTPVGPFRVLGGYNTAGYLDFKFWSDAALTYTGYWIDKLNLWCFSSTYSPPATNNTWVTRNYPHDGYLLGTDDVIYVKTKQPAGYEMALVLYPYKSSATAVDFDIVASTTDQTPSHPGEWNGTQGSGKGETIIIDPWTGQGERWIYIAIGSYAGAGQFRFYANIHAKPDNIYSFQTGTARTNFSPTDDEKEQIRDILRSTSRATYFGSDGRYLIKNWTIRWNYQIDFWPYPTHVFTKDHFGHPYCSSDADTGHPCGTGDGTYILWNSGAWCNWYDVGYPCRSIAQEIERQGAKTGAHEMGHCRQGLGDEYEMTNNCGHSLMQSEVYFVNVTDYCDWRNGGKDPEPQTASTHAQAHNNWDCLKQRWNNYIGYPQTTPDPFYRTCDTSQTLNCDHQLLENKIEFNEP